MSRAILVIVGLVLSLRDTSAVAVCDPANLKNTLNLSDITVWEREAGYWVGEYTFLGADGSPFVSQAWPYLYDSYMGFIKISVRGISLKQRNIFSYPPLSRRECRARRRASNTTVIGDGACGSNGNEKVFKADQDAVDCQGNLAGPFESGGFSVDTFTTVIGDDTVLYRVQLPAALGGGIIQNQLTTVFDGYRVRTAQGFGGDRAAYASFYRETRVTKQQWNKQLAQARRKYCIRKQDFCAYNDNNQLTGLTCKEWFAN